MREHRFVLEIPHPPRRVWALMQDYDRWTEYAPMVLRVEILHPGDAGGNGLLRRVIYKLPFGREGSALELITEVQPAAGYTYTMISRSSGNDQTGRVRLESADGKTTRLHFEERYHLTQIPWKWFEGAIYRFINRQNEGSMHALSRWLSEHPEYRADLA